MKDEPKTDPDSVPIPAPDQPGVLRAAWTRWITR